MLCPSVWALELVGNELTASGSATLGPAAPDRLGHNHRLGDFQIVREVGRGGMGVVYEAQQLSMGRQVALKVLPFASLANEMPLRRFKNEVRAVATLEHPNIVSVYSIGEERGVHYYAMQLIRGPSLAEVIRQLAELKNNHQPVDGDSISRLVSSCDPSEPVASNPGSPNGDPSGDSRPMPQRDTESARYAATTDPNIQFRVSTFAATAPSREFYRNAAKLGIQAAGALAHAHENGVLHRDIKPANLLLDANGNVYLTDFGLARIEADAGVTMTGQLIGTLRYMSPEQALTKRAAIDHRSDIYSLGITLYELLALQPAFRAASRHQILAQIAFEEPTKLRRLVRSIPVELETIIAKAIEKSPADRYENAQDFAEDLKRFLEEKPIRARPASWHARVWKWGKRHKTTLAPVLATLLFGIAIAGVLLWRERNETLAALASRTQALSERNQALVEAKKQAELAERVSQQSATLLYSADIKLAADAIANRDVRRAAELLQRHLLDGDNEDRRGFEWHYLHKQLNPPLTAELDQGAWVNDLAISPDGRWLAATAAQGTVRIYDTETWHRHSTLHTHSEEVNGLAWSPDGQQLAAACADGRLVVARFPLVADGIFTIESQHGQAYDVVFSPDSRTLYSCGEDHLAKSWNLESRALEHEFRGHRHALERIDLTLDGRWLATAGRDSTFAVWDTENGEQKHQWSFPTGSVMCVAFSPDGQRLAAGMSFGNLYLADLTTGTCRCETVLVDSVEAVAFSDHGRVLATADRGGAIQLHLLADTELPDNDQSDRSSVAKPSQRWMAHEDHAGALVATADGKSLVSGGRDGAVRVWSPDRQSTHWSLANDPVRTDVTVGKNHQLYTAGHAVSVWDLETQRLVGSFAASDPPWQRVDCSADGQYLAAARVGQLALFDLRSQRLVESWKIDARLTPHRLAISRTGRWIALADYTDQANVLVYQRDNPLAVRTLPALQCECLAFFPDERRLAAGGQNSLHFFELQTGRELRRLAAHSSTLTDVAFHPLGELLATVSHDRTLKVWQAETGELQTSIVAHSDRIRAVAWSPDGKTIATAGLYGDLRLWHATTGQPLGNLRRVASSLEKIAFDSTGMRLVSAVPQLGKIFVYDAKVMRSLRPHDSIATHSLAQQPAEFQGLGDLPGGAFGSLVDGISPDGTVAVGRHWAKDHWRALRWENGATTYLSELPEGQQHVQAIALAQHSEVTLGCAFNKIIRKSSELLLERSETISDAKPVIWNRDGTVQPLAGLDAQHNWWPSGISADGQVIVGRVWPVGESFHQPILNGNGQAGGNGQAFRWQAGEVTLLGMLPGCTSAGATTISGDGRTIAGICDPPAHPDTHATAFIWDAERGMRCLATVLAQTGANPGGWSIEMPHALSHDGRSLVGNGKNPQALQEAWFARLPSDEASSDK